MGKKPAKKKSSATNILKKKITHWVAEAQKRFLLEAWTISVVWTGKDETASMRVSCDAKYRKAEIEVSPKACKNYNDGELRFNCYHEMGHVLIGEYVALAEERYITKKQLGKAEEQLVEIIARLVLSKK